MDLTEEEYLAHYGILRKSGRYPWGTGKNPLQRSKTFLDIIKEHEKTGLSEAKIAEFYSTKEHPFTSADIRALKTRATTEVTRDKIFTAQKLREKGVSVSEIGRQMGINESSVRSLLEPGRLDRLSVLESCAEMLKRQVNEKEYVDVGAYVNLDLPLGGNGAPLGISQDKFNTALSMLKEEGYKVHVVKGDQVGTGEKTTYRVLTKPEITWNEARKNLDKIQLISESSPDHGRSFKDLELKPPLNIDPKRVAVRYAEQGGADADGVIYVRPGVKDIELGKSHYAQVRIAVGGTHYLKGMAIYKDDLPPGVDLMFNTNKSDTGDKMDALKKMKTDAEGNVDLKNPFGAAIKLGGQIKDDKGNVTSAMNLINEEGDWNKWAKTLSRQVLSKQSPDVAKSQLDFTYDRRRQEYEEIKALTNPTIRKKLLETFSEETDSAGVQLKAAAMPKQVTRVILPVPSMKPTEIFAPAFKDGERVVLLRFPHAGRFEIPELTVNNRNREARKLFGLGKGGKATDAVGIHPKVAQHLSGADFDGDTVVVIPNRDRKISTKPPLHDLKDFDPQAAYKPYDGMKTIDGGTYRAATREVDYGTKADGTPRRPRTGNKQNEMGKVTNLIADMTIKGATDSELAQAVKHSMVVIDAEKHSLDYKRSERENGIIALKKKYQGVHPDGKLKGASTLITRATSTERVPLRKDAKAGPGLTRISNATVDNKTGEKVYEYTGETDRRGKLRTFESKKLAETDDAFTLISDHGGKRIEKIYAEHSNKLKALANEARKELIHTKDIKRDPNAAKVYSKEVESLKSKLTIAQKNAPRERQAQALAASWVAQRKRANPEMDGDDLRKIKGQMLTEARVRTDANKTRIGSKDSPITSREWDAIQAGAISTSVLTKILANSDIDKIRELAQPKENPVMTTAIQAQAKRMLASGYTLSEVSEHLNIPQSTLNNLEG